jgi:acetyl-CoA synthetase
MIPELAVAMLACARIGAVHSVVFGGFSSDALADRILDADARVVITQDGAWRGRNVVPLKANTDVSLARTPGRAHTCIVVRRTENDVTMEEGRDVWWHDLVDGSRRVRAGGSWGPRIRSTSSTPPGTTGKPKGIVHTQGGYLTGGDDHPLLGLRHQARRRRVLVRRRHRLGDRAQLHRVRAARQPDDRCDVRGRSQLPDFDRLWSIIAEYGVTIFYTAPTAIRAFMKWGDEYPAATTCPACGCSARSVSRSTPRPGSGTTTTSAGSAARSSTPGGRPRRGRS